MSIETLHFAASTPAELQTLYKEYPNIKKYIQDNDIKLHAIYADVNDVRRDSILPEADSTPGYPPNNKPIPVAMELDEKDAVALKLKFGPILR